MKTYLIGLFGLILTTNVLAHGMSEDTDHRSGQNPTGEFPKVK